MIRLRTDESIPIHVGSAHLRGWLRVSGWVLAVAGMLGGLVVLLETTSTPAELLGTLLILASGFLGAGLVRCKRFEITVGTKRIEAAAGPLRTVVAAAALESASRRRATSWRRLYSDDEVVLRINVGSGELIVPVAEPDELLSALAGRP